MHIVFADLDGTVLDHESYSHRVAEDACRRLEEAGVVLCFVSSKTRSEMEYFRELLHNVHPFVCENGGAVLFPSYPGDNHPEIVTLGTTYKTLTSFLRTLREEHGIQARGFAQMSVKEIAKACGLPKKLARLARKRRYDEPFTLPEDQQSQFRRIQRLARAKGMQCTKGSRFFHLLGKSDKGKAVRLLIKELRKQHEKVRTYAVGDSLNDVPMLKAARVSFLVRRPNRKHDSTVLRQVRRVHRVSGIGPLGFVMAAEKILQYAR